MKNYLFVILIILLVIFRLVWLDRFPTGLSHDEVMYSLNGASYLFTGKDLSGIPFPLSIFRTKTEGTLSIVPSLSLSLFYHFFGVDQLNVRTLYTIFGLAAAFVIYFLSKSLFRNSKIALFSVIMFLSNPWSFGLYRWCSDAPLALLFYLAGITLLIKTHSWKQFLISFGFFLLGFFSYQGAKPILLPLVGVIILFKRFGGPEFRINNFQSIIYSSIFLSFFIAYFIIDSILPGKFSSGRLNEIFLLNSTYLSSIVDQQRKTSIQGPLSFVYSNKFTVSLNTFVSKYLTSFSTEVLFISGDPRATYKFGEYGLLNYYDVFLIPLGFIYLFYSYRKVFFLILGLLFLAPLSTAINIVATSVINRSFMLEPIFVILSSLGIYKIYELLGKRLNFNISFAIITSVLLLSFGNFLHFYFYTYPILSQENNFFSERLIGKYFDLNYQKGTNLEIYATLPKSALNENVFFNFKTLHQDYYANHKFNFFEGCPKVQPKGVWVLDSRLACQIEEKNRLAIKDPKDAGSLYYLYNDQLCQGVHDTYRSTHLTSDYDIDKMDAEKFCSRWIFKD